MREILFRGKQADNSEWIVGSLLQDDDGKTYIVGYEHRGGIDGMIDAELTSWAVIPETVGQYTGLLDKNGTKIFEGDIVKGIAYSVTKIGVIVWIDEISSFGVRYAQNLTAWENSSILRCVSMGKTDEFAAEVIGNIYDNPELIGGETNG